jgi:AcrR family transcriptional regulator
MARRILRSSRKSNLLVRDVDVLQQKREAVADAAFELFLKEGFHRTTTRDIARRAGVSAGAPFTYFRDKEDILLYIISKEQDRAEEQLVETLSRQIAEATRTGADPEAVLATVVTTFLRAVDALRRFILLAYQETKSLNSEARQALIGREKRLQAIIGEAIRYGAERGRFAPDYIPLKAHSIMVLAQAWAVRRWAFVGELDSIEDYIAFLLPQVLAMVESGAGAKESTTKRPRFTAVSADAAKEQTEISTK